MPDLWISNVDIEDSHAGVIWKNKGLCSDSTDTYMAFSKAYRCCACFIGLFWGLGTLGQGLQLKTASSSLGSNSKTSSRDSI